jgi:phospholipid/cholesterol/gamma-HCH transport system ATP-binding protein
MAQLLAPAVESGAPPPNVDGQVPVVVFDRVTLAFDEKVVLKDLSFTLQPGRLKVFLGASGAGKSTILRLILGLLRADAGEIWVHGQRVDQLSEADLMPVRSDIGMVFQEGALFDSLTVRENVGYRLYEETRQPIAEVDQRVDEVLGFVSLRDMADRMPAELSGGQRRRVAIARALTSRPKLLLYDEPTTGLDPITALTVDAEIVKLRDLEHTSSIVVTHQLRDAFYIATHQARMTGGRVELAAVPPEDGQETEFIMLKSGGIVFEGTAAELRATADPYLRSFLS